MKPSHVLTYAVAAMFGLFTSLQQTQGGYHSGQAFQGVNAFAMTTCVIIAAFFLAIFSTPNR